MLWLIWHMWILIALAFLGGLIAGWVIRARSDVVEERPQLEALEAEVVIPAREAAPAEADREPVTEPELQPEIDPPQPKPEENVTRGQASASSQVDDLTSIKGLGPKAAEKLNSEGVSRFEQIAVWTKADVERFDALINGRGRIGRDEWVKQAKKLAKG